MIEETCQVSVSLLPFLRSCAVKQVFPLAQCILTRMTTKIPPISARSNPDGKVSDLMRDSEAVADVSSKIEHDKDADRFRPERRESTVPNEIE